MNDKYLRLKELSEKVEPVREHKFGEWQWMTRVKTLIRIKDLDSNHLGNIIRLTRQANWTDFYAGHTRKEWLEALVAERYFREEKSIWDCNQNRIRRLKRKNNKP